MVLPSLPAAAERLAQRDHRLQARQLVLSVLIACRVQGPLRFEYREEIACAFSIAELGAVEGALGLSQAFILEVPRGIETANGGECVLDIGQRGEYCGPVTRD